MNSTQLSKVHDKITKCFINAAMHNLFTMSA